MRVRLPALAVASLVLAACGGGGPSPAGFAYTLPEPPTLTYTQGDTANMDIDAGGQSMQARVTTSATLDAAFARADDGLRVSMTFRDFSARMSQPMGGPVTSDEDDIDGPLVLRLDRRGDASLVERPDLSGTAEQFVASLSMAHSFFPGVPGGPADMGESWTDTVRYEGEEGGGEISAVNVLTYTVAGDTTVAGRSAVRIDFVGVAESSSEGIIAGMDFAQSVSGDMEGHVLWDFQRGMLLERVTDTDLRGSMEVSAAPFPLGIRLRGQSTIRLVEGM